jgi:flagellar biosynthetic protein FliR
MSLDSFLSGSIFAFIMIVARFGTAIMLMPGFGDLYVAPRIRLSLVVMIALILVPVVGPILPPEPSQPAQLLKLIAGEIFVGAFLGGMIRVLMSTLSTAGTVIAYHAGAANALVFDPVSIQQSSVYATFLVNLGMVLIFVTDLHHLMLLAVYDSYAVMVPGAIFPFGDFSEAMALKVAESFSVGMRIASPVILAGVIFYVGLGLMSRLMPQMQVFFIGLPIQIFLGLSVLGISLPIMMYTFLAYFQDGLTGMFGR